MDRVGLKRNQAPPWLGPLQNDKVIMCMGTADAEKAKEVPVYNMNESAGNVIQTLLTILLVTFVVLGGG